MIISLGCSNIFYQVEVKSPDGKNKFILHLDKGNYIIKLIETKKIISKSLLGIKFKDGQSLIDGFNYVEAKVIL